MIIKKQIDYWTQMPKIRVKRLINKLFKVKKKAFKNQLLKGSQVESLTQFKRYKRDWW